MPNLKLVSFVLAHLVFANTHAVESFQCITYVPTTSSIVEKNGDRLRLDYIHHNGVQFAPIHAGIITSHDLPLIQKKGELLAKMGDQITVYFAAENCKVHGEGNYHCFARGPIKIGQLEVASYGFITHQTQSVLFGSTFPEFTFKFYARTSEGVSLESEMAYPLTGRDCRFDKF